MGTKKRKQFQKVLIFTALSLILTFLVTAIVFWVTTPLDEVPLLKSRFPVVHYQGPKRPFTITLEPKRPAHWASLSEISRNAIGAVIVSEDWAFFQHKGFDPKQIEEAARDAIEDGGRLRGASTLTQQVAKNVFLNQERSFVRKIRELAIAVELEKTTSKHRILETYFNIAEWGEGIFGITQAAQYYFQKSPQELLPREGAFLAMLLPSPKKYSVSFRNRLLTRYARKRIDSILEKMAQAGYIDASISSQEMDAPLSFELFQPIEK